MSTYRGDTRPRPLWKDLAGLALLAMLPLLSGQETDVLVKLTSPERAAVAAPDFRGAGEAQPLMDVFNQVLFADLQESGVFRMAPKSMYPLNVPQRPQDFRQPRAGQLQSPKEQNGLWLTDWASPPVNADYLATGYTAVQNGQLVLFGWFYNVKQPDLANAQVIGKLYFGSSDEAGARKVAHEFAADILERFGAKSLAGTKVYFTSTRTGNKEIWVMDHDGANQRQVTRLSSITTFAAASPDGSRLAFTTFAKGNPSIGLMSLETGRMLPFYNQRASMNATPTFSPDGQKLLFSSTAGGKSPQIFVCNLDGSDLQRISTSAAIEVEPKVNPVTGREMVFVSGRSGVPQVYKMNLDGTDVVRLTSGEGDAVNPSWHPNGQLIAFSWTRGFAPGNFNIFIMDVASGKLVQLTHGTGRNENPGWAPDGRHIVFSSNRSGTPQIWTMLADGTELRQLTTQGRNENPVWSK